MIHSIKRLIQIAHAGKRRLEEIKHWADKGDFEKIKKYFEEGGSGLSTIKAITQVTEQISQKHL